MIITGMCYSGNRRCILIVHKIADTVLRTTQISTTQIIKTNIVGVGAGYRKGPVRRMLLKEFMIAWLFTVPASAFLSATIYWGASGALGYGMGSFDHIMAVLGF